MGIECSFARVSFRLTAPVERWLADGPTLPAVWDVVGRDALRVSGALRVVHGVWMSGLAAIVAFAATPGLVRRAWGPGARRVADAVG